MFTLIKREIEDHIAYFLGAIIFATIFIAIALSVTYSERHEGPPTAAIALFIPTAFIAIFGFWARTSSLLLAPL